MWTEEKGEENGVTKKELEQYCKMRKEVAYLQKRLDKLYDRDVPEISGKVQASSPDYPCIMQRVSVQMYEPKANDERNKVIALLEDRQRRCEEKMLEIERYIDKIEDAELRQIFEMRYMEGRKLREIAYILNQDLSGIGKKITKHLEKGRKGTY
ncbi:MAG: sigma-70 family RNA polymerase sigma factor [Lachnospiraceae bacterium]|nr:sigma-70 family RNA polymerase sigma factor [Lachnospiraceae bacterium]